MIFRYLKQLRQALVFIATLIITVSVTAQPPLVPNTLPALIANFNNYKTTNYTFHSGDLFEHSWWSSYAANNFILSRSFWSTDLTERETELAFIGALLHDIGKAGDLQKSYKQKHNHPHSGFEYVIQKRPYKMNDEQTFDFNKMFSRLGVTKDEQKIIAILVGCHYKFGDYMQRKITKKEYLDAIFHYAQQVNYDTGKITIALVKMAILVSASDVRGSQPVIALEPFIGDAFGLEAKRIKMPKAHGKPPKTTNYDRFNFDNYGQRCRQEIVDYFPEWITCCQSGLINTIVNNLSRAYQALTVSRAAIENRNQPIAENAN